MKFSYTFGILIVVTNVHNLLPTLLNQQKNVPIGVFLPIFMFNLPNTIIEKEYPQQAK